MLNADQPRSAPFTTPEWDRVDGVLLVLIFAAVAAYLSLLPWGLQSADESYFLNEAKRIRDGELMYRDIFEFTTPLSPYAMAAMFWIFGTTMATARITMAVVHALTAVALYASARGVGVRKPLSLVVPLAYVALCQSVWPYASWHWFSTCAAAVALCSLIRGPWPSRPAWAVVPGLVGGLAVAIQQQKGAVLTAGVGLVFVVDALLDRRYGARVAWRALLARLAWFAGGVAAVVVPVLGTFVLLAGWTKVYDALVRFPLETYGPHFTSPWGRAGKYEAQFTIPLLLQLSPLLLIPSFLRWFSDVRFARERERVRRLTPLVVMPSAGVLSTWYFPDLIHLAFIAGVFWVAAAEGAEWVIDAMRPAVSRAAGVAVAVGVAALLLPQLVSNTRLMREQFSFPYRTAFGRVDFSGEWEAALVDTTRALLADAPSRELFSYPHYLSLYLTADAKNPTPYQYFWAATSPPEHTSDVLRTLQSRRLPYILACPFLFRPNDPVADYISENYELYPMPGEPVGNYRLYGRKDLDVFVKKSKAPQ